MGWFDRLLGRETSDEKADGTRGERKPRAWDADYLMAVAKAAGVTDAVVVPKPQDHTMDLRGNIRGLPLRITLNDSGGVHDFTIKHADLADRTYLDLEYDRDIPDDPPVATVDPFEPGEKQIFLAPKIHVEGSDAETQAAKFKKIPADLQARILRCMREDKVLYFRSRYFEHDITLYDDMTDRSDPVASLARILSLAGELAAHRGAKPPRAGGEEASELDGAKAIAETIAKQVSFSKVVVREDDECVDVRWTIEDVPVRIVVDYGFDHIDVEARVAGATGDFDLNLDEAVTIEKRETGDAWDAVDRHIFFAKSVFVHGPESAARREAAMIRAIGDELVDKLVDSFVTYEYKWVGLDHEDEVLKTVYRETLGLDDREIRYAIALADLFARVANKLPRGEVAAGVEAVKCPYCGGMWFPSPARTVCSHCGAK